MINQISPNRYSNILKNAAVLQEKADVAGGDERLADELRTDSVEISNFERQPVMYSPIASKKKLSSGELASIKSMAGQANENLRRTVERLIVGQGKATEKFQIKAFAASGGVSQRDIEQARSAIAPGGELGVDTVSNRLVEFAKMISGGDEKKYEELKGAIIDGFEAARQALGGTLPEISQQTYRETMRKLDAWAGVKDN